MAGAGYKLFINGNTLSASDLNTYLQQQTIMVFATTTARDTALTGVLAEGMFCYITGTGLMYYNGSAWVTNGIGDVTLTGVQTLTNKTLTSPIISSISNTGTLTLPTSTDTIVGRATTDALSNKSLTAPLENFYQTATGFAGYTFYAQTNGGVQYCTGNSTANGTLNITSASGVTLNTVMAIGQSISVVLLITNSTAYYPNLIQVDGSTVTVKWAGGTAPSAGNASAVDAWSFIIIKTANATFTVLGSQVKFA